MALEFKFFVRLPERRRAQLKRIAKRREQEADVRPITLSHVVRGYVERGIDEELKEFD